MQQPAVSPALPAQWVGLLLLLRCCMTASSIYCGWCVTICFHGGVAAVLDVHWMHFRLKALSTVEAWPIIMDGAERKKERFCSSIVNRLHVVSA
jgi:hypothetical protein